MGPQNHGLEKDFPFNYGHFWCVGVSFPGIFRSEVNLLGGLQSSCILKLSLWECVFLEGQLVSALSMLNLFAVSCVLKVYNQNQANNLFQYTP